MQCGTQAASFWFLLPLLTLLLAPLIGHVWQLFHAHVSPGMKISSSWKIESWHMLLAEVNIPGPALEQPVGLFHSQAAGGLLCFILSSHTRYIMKEFASR